MRMEHACNSIISFVASFRRAQSGDAALNGGSMNTARHFRSLDDVLFVIMLFAPVSLLLAGALALAAIG
jgi:hypothetical protein